MSKKSRPPQNGREGRRMRAWELHEAGWKHKDSAAALGVSEGAVSQWFKKAKAQGGEALRHQPPPGRQAQLSAEQMAQLPTLLARGAISFGFPGDVWTTARVVEMIRQQFGVSYHRAHGSRLLRKIKQSRQKPIPKATQRDEAAIAAWKRERWPALKKSPSRKSAHESLSINRLFIYLRWPFVARRPWAKRPLMPRQADP
jgi:transposase